VRRAARIAFAAACAAACSGSGSTGPAAPSRTYRMGFSDFPPRLTFQAYQDNIAAWTPRADAAIMHESPPWKELLAGARPDSLVITERLAIANYYHAHGFTIFATIDLTNGLKRSEEHPDLVAAGRSITEPAIQAMERGWLVAFDTLVRPEYLGLAAETNLIRDAAPANVYAAVVQMTNDGAADLRARSPTPKLYVSVQVDDAWGRLGGPPGYKGVERDYTDFPFIQALGLSSYPYFAYVDPDSVPLDYYARLRNGRATPTMVVEGGWTSASVGTITSDVDEQRRFFTRHRALLDSVHAIAWLQLDYADFDTTGRALPPGSVAPLFAYTGVATVDLAPKPALAVWDSTFALPLRP